MEEPSLNGVTLRVDDLDRSVEYYSKIPNVKQIVYREGEFALFQIGIGRLGLIEIDGPEFHVEIGTDDLDALYQELVEAELDVEPPEEKPWGDYTIETRDPDGHTIEFEAERDE